MQNTEYPPDVRFETEARLFWREIEGKRVKLGGCGSLKMSSKESRDGISDKLSDLIEAIRDSSEKKTEEKERLSTGGELRRLFPSIRTKIAEDSRPRPKQGKTATGNFLNRPKKARSTFKGKVAKSTSTVTTMLKDVFFLLNPKGVPKYARRTKLVKEGYVKSAVQFTSDMEQEEIFSTIREKFYDKFGGNVPVFKILKAYGSQLVTPNLDGEWNFKVLKHQCGNGPVYVCPDTVVLTVGSSDEEEDDNEEFPEANFTKAQVDTTECLAPIPSLKPQCISKESISTAKVACPVCQVKIPCYEIETHADMCAEKATALKSYAHLVEDITDDQFLEEMENEMQQPSTDQTQVASDMTVKEYRKAIKEELSTRFDMENNENMCHMSVRRLHAWKDYVSFFSKPWNKKKATWPIIVTFLGEAAVDTGGPRREFFSGM